MTVNSSKNEAVAGLDQGIDVTSSEIGNEAEVYRADELEEIYREFDIDRDGSVGEEEMFALGTARFELGQKSTPWTHDHNKTLLEQMGCEGNENVSMRNFVDYFMDKLDCQSNGEFIKTMEQFMECARKVRHDKHLSTKEHLNRLMQTKDDGVQDLQKQLIETKQSLREMLDAEDDNENLKRELSVTKKKLNEMSLAQSQEDAEELTEIKQKLHALMSQQRVARLEEVYREFDMDGDGCVGEEEMFALGTARRTLGQRQFPWMRTQNTQMIEHMGCDKHMNVSMSNFVMYWINKLASESDYSFNSTIVQFLDCARALRNEKSAALKEQLRLLMQAQRSAKLEQVYREFDIDHDGSVGEKEIFEIGTARRKLHKKFSPWTHDQNAQLLDSIGCDSNMHVSMSNFVLYWIDVLSTETDDTFIATVDELLKCARSLGRDSSQVSKADVEEFTAAATMEKVAGVMDACVTATNGLSTAEKRSLDNAEKLQELTQAHDDAASVRHELSVTKNALCDIKKALREMIQAQDDKEKELADTKKELADRKKQLQAATADKNEAVEMAERLAKLRRNEVDVAMADLNEHQQRLLDQNPMSVSPTSPKAMLSANSSRLRRSGVTSGSPDAQIEF